MGRVPAARGDRPPRTYARLVAPGTSLGDRLGSLLEPLAATPRGTVFDAELVALSSRDGRAVQDFAAVCRATLQADARRRASSTSLPSTCSSSPARTSDRCPGSNAHRFCGRLSPPATGCGSFSAPASRAAHDQLVALGFEGSVLKRPGSAYRPGRQTTWRKYKASHRATATLLAVRPGRDGHTYAISDLDGRRVTTLGSPRLAELIGQQVELAYSRIDAEARCARSGSARSTASTLGRGNHTRRLMRGGQISRASHSRANPRGATSEVLTRRQPARGEAKVSHRAQAASCSLVGTGSSAGTTSRFRSEQ